MFGLPFYFGLSLTAGLLAIGHWFPWPQRLHRLAAYTYGVGAILAGASLWLGLTGAGRTWLGLVVFAAVGGATVGLCWLVDAIFNLIARRRVQE